MTNYIEEMMKTAGIEKRCLFKRIKGNHCSGVSCDCCKEIGYPDFTAEKQIEVIKLLATNNIAFKKSDISKGFVFATFVKKGYEISENQDFTQALAQFTTELINAGELDKEKVKEILQG